MSSSLYTPIIIFSFDMAPCALRRLKTSSQSIIMSVMRVWMDCEIPLMPRRRENVVMSLYSSDESGQRFHTLWFFAPLIYMRDDADDSP